MKTTFLTMALSIMLAGTAIAGPDRTCALQSYPEEIKYLMGNCKSFFDADLNGKVSIIFTVDENNVIHVRNVNSSNVFLENHALCALEGSQLSAECLNATETYTINVVFKDNTYQ